MTRDSDRPIGIFDSGIGGLTVLREIRRILPRERLVYLGDTARLPYGTKSSTAVTRFALENSAFLVRHQVKLLVVACNTASAYSLDAVQKKFPLPVLGVVEPGARAAVEASQGRIGVVGTEGTISSQAYPKAIARLNPSLLVFSQACPLLVPLVEEGWLDNEISQKVVEHYLTDLRKREIDTLVLGCTHYPLLKAAVGKVMGEGVRVIDSAEATSAEVASLLRGKGLARPEGEGDCVVYVTDHPQRFERVGRLFLREGLPPIQQVDVE